MNGRNWHTRSAGERRRPAISHGLLRHESDGKHYLIASDGTILAAFSKVGISLPVLRAELAKHGIK
jgi:hypothetical protein